jgi:hypothetical protein
VTPQGYPINIKTGDGKVYLIIGWVEGSKYDSDFKPIGIQVSAPRETADTIEGPWMVVAR